jgi:hypothetical protein
MSSVRPTEPDVGVPTENEASGKGHGTLEIREVTTALGKVGIPSCIVGVSALMYFGARRVGSVSHDITHQHDKKKLNPWLSLQGWDICVPTKQLEAAISFLRGKSYSAINTEVPPPPNLGLSLFDTYPRFKCIGFKELFFHVVPARATNLRCHPSSFERSRTGLPYSKLHISIQSVIDTRDSVALADAIDGMNLSEEWRIDNLDLTYADDTRWPKWANERLDEAGIVRTFMSIPTNAYDRRVIWQKAVEGKQRRGGWKYPEKIYATRLRMYGSADPRTRDRVHV